MKIVVEINDETLTKAIGNQLQEAVGREVSRRLEADVAKILDTKLERVDNVIATAVNKLLAEHLKRRQNYNDRDGLEKYFESAALAVVKEKLK